MSMKDRLIDAAASYAFKKASDKVKQIEDKAKKDKEARKPKCEAVERSWTRKIPITKMVRERGQFFRKTYQGSKVTAKSEGCKFNCPIGKEFTAEGLTVDQATKDAKSLALAYRMKECKVLNNKLK